MAIEPVDLKRCQGEKRQASAFQMGGGVQTVNKLVRCKNQPSVVVREAKPGSDGFYGEMSLCASCLEVAKTYFPQGHFTITPIVVA